MVFPCIPSSTLKGFMCHLILNAQSNSRQSPMPISVLRRHRWYPCGRFSECSTAMGRTADTSDTTTANKATRHMIPMGRGGWQATQLLELWTKAACRSGSWYMLDAEIGYIFWPSKSDISVKQIITSSHSIPQLRHLHGQFSLTQHLFAVKSTVWGVKSICFVWKLAAPKFDDPKKDSANSHLISFYVIPIVTPKPIMPCSFTPTPNVAPAPASSSPQDMEKLRGAWPKLLEWPEQG